MPSSPADSPASSFGSVVAALVADGTVVDGHNDLMWEAREQVGYDFDRLDIAGRLTTTHTDLPRLREGGVGAQFWSVFVPSTLQGDAAVIATLEQIDGVHRMIGTYAADLALARTADEVDAARASGRIASLLGAEGGHSIGSSMATLRLLHVLGVRYLTLTHNDNIPWADSATDVEAAGGLTPFGRAVVGEMNRLGMLVDLSHVSAATMRDALDVASAPVIFSHSSARALCDVTRNVPDDVLAQLPDNGGVCMVTFVPEFISTAVADWRVAAAEKATECGIDPKDWVAFQAFSQSYQEGHPKPDATVEDVVAHIEHVREVAGLDHVGIGGDYDGTDTFPLGMADVSGYPRLMEALLERSWSEQEVRQVLGENVLRVMRGAEEVARDLQTRQAPSLVTIEELDG